MVVYCFAMFVWGRAAPDIVTTSGLTVLLIFGVVTPEQGLAGFSNQGMLTVGVLYVVVTGLTGTGAVQWIVHSVLGRPHNETSARLRLMGPVAAISAFLNNTPVVAVFIPAVEDWAKRNRLELSRLMIPLSYASIAGGSCTLIGTSTNLVVDGLYQSRTGEQGFGLIELAWIGVPIVLVVVIYLVTIGHWLLPRRVPMSERYEDAREYVVEMLVPPSSTLIGQSIEQAGLRQLPGLFVVELQRGDQIIPAVSPLERLQGGDRLVFAGIVDSVMDLQRTRGLIPATNQLFKLDDSRQGRSFVEAVLSDACPLVGKRVRDGRFRNRYGAVIIAIARHGERVPGKIGDLVLRAGDTLLLECRRWFVEQQRNARDFLLISQVGGEGPPSHERAGVALAIVTGMVGAVLLGFLSMLEGALVAAGLMILTGCTDGRTARRAPDWQVLVVIATSFGIGAALDESGAAAALAGGLVSLAQGGPLLSLALVFIATAVLTALATNNVAALILFPIAMQTAGEIGASPLPFLVVVMVAASASFATPIGYQTNLMVFNAGGYRFGDFVRIGLPLTLLVGFITVVLAPIIWPL